MANFPVMERWGTDPLFIGCRKTFVAVVQETLFAQQRSGLIELYYFGRPVTRVQLVGTVVQLVRTEKRTYVHIDDGTGVMPCLHFLQPGAERPYDDLRVGHLASVIGELIFVETNMDPYCLHLGIKSLDVLLEPNLELLHWASALHLHQSVYCQPYCRPEGMPPPVISAAAIYGPEAAVRGAEACACTRTSFLALSPSASTSASTEEQHTLRRSLRYDPLFPLRSSLLYCPCHATAAPLDPMLSFRWRLLRHLGWDPSEGHETRPPVTFCHSHLSRPEVLQLVRAHARAEQHCRDKAVWGRLAPSGPTPESQVLCKGERAEKRARGATGGGGFDQTRGQGPITDPDPDQGQENEPENGGSQTEAVEDPCDWEEGERLLVEQTVAALLHDGVALRKGDAYLIVTQSFLLPTLRLYVDRPTTEETRRELQIAFPTIPLWRWGLCQTLL